MRKQCVYEWVWRVLVVFIYFVGRSVSSPLERSLCRYGCCCFLVYALFDYSLRVPHSIEDSIPYICVLPFSSCFFFSFACKIKFIQTFVLIFYSWTLIIVSLNTKMGIQISSLKNENMRFYFVKHKSSLNRSGYIKVIYSQFYIPCKSLGSSVKSIIPMISSLIWLKIS